MWVVFIDKYNHIHVKLPQVQHKQNTGTQTSTRSYGSYRIHVQIYPLAGPVVTAPESLFLKSCPSSALVLTPLEGPLWLRTSPLHDVIPRGPAVCTKLSSLALGPFLGKHRKFKNQIRAAGDAGWRCLISVLSQGWAWAPFFLC